jgi:hypothetical protein
MATTSMSLAEQAQLLTDHPALAPIFLEHLADDEGVIHVVGFTSDHGGFDVFGRQWKESH